MKNLKITAHLGTAIATADDYSPSLDALLFYLLLDREGVPVGGNPTPDQVRANYEKYAHKMPLQQGDLNGEPYWKISAPCYQIEKEQVDRYRKRWDYHDHALNWGKRKAKWSGSEGAEKNYDLPLYLRVVPVITWYGVGDRQSIQNLLGNCTGLGKKRSYGHGQVTRWSVEEIKEDWHLWRGDRLMKPIPYRLVFSDPRILQNSPRLLNWGWKMPGWMLENRELCVMPDIVQKECV